MDLKYCLYVTRDVQLRIHLHMELAVASVTSHIKLFLIVQIQEPQSVKITRSYCCQTDHKVILSLTVRVQARHWTSYLSQLQCPVGPAQPPKLFSMVSTSLSLLTSWFYKSCFQRPNFPYFHNSFLGVTKSCGDYALTCQIQSMT